MVVRSILQSTIDLRMSCAYTLSPIITVPTCIASMCRPWTCAASDLPLPSRHARDANSRPLMNDYPSASKSTSQTAQELIATGAMYPSDERLFAMLSDSRAALFAKVLANRTRHITFVLDGVHGAHNLAAIARSCDAWGIQDLHIVEQQKEDRSKPHDGKEYANGDHLTVLESFKYKPSVQNVSRNCHKWLSIREYTTAELCIKQLRCEGYRIIVSSLSSDATSIHDMDLSQKCAFVFGNEKYGVTKDMAAQADGFFTVPMMGFVESMNVSVAVGTTACLTVTKCRNFVTGTKYNLSLEERRELARLWLKDRFSSSQSSGLLRTSRDVTKLGYVCEAKVVKEGMFAAVDDDSLSPEEYWKLALRLTGDGGRHVAADFSRRKIGVLGGTGFRKRCLALNIFVGGACALTCEAALVQSGSLVVSRQTLNNYFKAVCESVSAKYEPYFDQYGVPILPIHAVEFYQTFENLESVAPGACRTVCIEAARDLFGLDAEAVESLVGEANIHHVVRCISDTVRCGQRRTLELTDVVKDAKRHLASLRHLLPERFTDEASLGIDLSQIVLENECAALFFQRQCDILQVLLRLSNTALLCSEVHQTIWDRHVHTKGTIRVHSLSFNLLEVLMSDSYAEMLLLNAPHSTALFRGILEWADILNRLKSNFGYKS